MQHHTCQGNKDCTHHSRVCVFSVSSEVKPGRSSLIPDIKTFGGTVREVGTSSCTDIPGGTEVDMMEIDRLLQSMTRGGDRAGSRTELLTLLYSYN